MTKENNLCVEVELIAKAYATNGIILVAADYEHYDLSFALVQLLKGRSEALRPISIKDQKRFDDAGLKEMGKTLYKQIPAIDLNSTSLDNDAYSIALEVLAFSTNNENNLLVVIKDTEDDEPLNNAVAVANALKIGVLLLDPETDLVELVHEVAHYLFR